jgi:hypothetical protein
MTPPAIIIRKPSVEEDIGSMKIEFHDLDSAQHDAGHDHEFETSIAMKGFNTCVINQEEMTPTMDEECERSIQSRGRQAIVKRHPEVTSMSKEDLKDLVLARLPPISHHQISNSVWDAVLEDFREITISPESSDNSKERSLSPPKSRRGAQGRLEDLALKDLEDSLTGVSEITPFSEFDTAHDYFGASGEDEEYVFPSARWSAIDDSERYDRNRDVTIIGLFAPARQPSINSITSSASGAKPICALPPLKPIRQRSAGSTCAAYSHGETTLSLPLTQESLVDSMKKQARFGTVQVRFYEQEIEVNPSVSNGVAVGIGWGYKCCTLLTIDEWEAQKAQDSHRSMSQLVIPRRTRERMLLEAGFTQKDIAHAMRQIRRVKNQRKTTIEQLKMKRYTDEAIESVIRKLKRLISFRGAKEGDPTTDSSSSEGLSDDRVLDI